ncbi:MAG: iron-sulfur cluster assembly scaffold protein [Rhodospirillales bacterium]
MSDGLYHDSIVALARSRDGSGLADTADAEAIVDNPLCGDRITLQLDMADGRISAIRHKVRGCALCEASAAMIARHAAGLDAAECRDARNALKRIVRDGAADSGPWEEMAAFAPVHARKSRHDCVFLPFDALDEALGTF